jgi:hypothetical protein
MTSVTVTGSDRAVVVSTTTAPAVSVTATASPSVTSTETLVTVTQSTTPVPQVVSADGSNVTATIMLPTVSQVVEVITAGPQGPAGVGSTPITTLVALVRNRTGVTIPKGSAVYISGATGQTSTISLALATTDLTSAQTLGLTQTAINNNQSGYVVVIGYLEGINTSAYNDGDQLYLSPTVPGGFTHTKPHAPNHIVYIAVVEYAHPVQGKLFVKVQNGYELDEIHDVQIVTPGAGHILQYDAVTGLWKNVATIGPQNGGTGATSLTGYVKGAGGDAFEGVAGIPASDISTPIDCGTFA